jgi:urate oxidase
MSDTTAFIKYIKRRLSGANWFTTQGFTNQQVYRQYLPQVKQPVFPCLTLSYEVDKREVFADVDDLCLFVSVHAKDFDTAEQVAKLISDTLHKHTYSDDQLTIYKCHDVGIPTVPSFNKDLNCWEAVVEFDCQVG